MTNFDLTAFMARMDEQLDQDRPTVSFAEIGELMALARRALISEHDYTEVARRENLLLSAIVMAAGGKVSIPKHTLAKIEGATLTRWSDEASDSFCFRVSRQ